MSSSGAVPAGGGLGAALATVSPDAFGDRLTFEYGATKVLVEHYQSATSDDDRKRWLQPQTVGMGSLAAYVLLVKDQLGIDPVAADWSLSVGQPPGAMTILHGGQNADRVTKAARAGGWKGDEVLSVELGGTTGDLMAYATFAAKIRPAGTDLYLGGVNSDPTKAGLGTPTTPPAPIAQAVACLDDPVFAMGDAGMKLGNSTLVAVGAKVAGGQVTAELCWSTGSAADAKQVSDLVTKGLAGKDPAQNRPWSELLPGAKVEIVNDTSVRLTADLSADLPVTLPISLMVRGDLPGVCPANATPAQCGK